MALSERTALRGDDAVIERLLELAGPAYRLALRVVGSHEVAEDVVQQAYLEAFVAVRKAKPLQEERPWFLKVVANIAKKQIRGKTRRRRREAIVEARRPASSGSDANVISALSGALSMLEEKYRLPVALCYEEGLSRREAATVLDLHERALSRYINTGLERLRKTLERAGYPAAVAAVLGGLKQTAPTVPASLGARVEALMAKGAATQLATGGSAAAAAAKGGLAMKVVAGIVLAGAVAASVAVVLPERGTEPLPAEKPKRKFATPVTDPGAQWVKASGAELRQRLRPPDAPPGSAVDVSWDDTFALSWGVGGELDGPQGLQMMTKGWTTRPSLLGGLSTGGRYVFLSYDRRTERIHGVTGGAAGMLDGPFDRARFYATDYVPRQGSNELLSPDGRYGYVVEYGRLRCLDFAEQRVSTLLPSAGYLAVDGQGKVYSVAQWAKSKELVVLDPAKGWKDPRIVKLQGKDADGEWFGAVSNSIAVDEVHGRLYAMSSRKWTLWYWDLKDGSFHGLIRVPGKDEPSRYGGIGGGTPGPFKGFRCYGEGTLGWGPDDPAKRFLYMGLCDDNSLYRLDLEKEVVWALDLKVGRFVDRGGARRLDVFDPGMMRPTWLEDGSFAYGWVGKFVFYKRVK